jgi:uncharacterized protein YndB with AHSA1/START domain
VDTVVAAQSVRIVRLFEASPERVFAAWTDPEQFKAWMSPPGFALDHCELDAQAGGAWRVRGSKPDGTHFAKSGKYLEVKRAERLIFTWASHADDTFRTERGHETIVEVTFRSIGDKTELALVHGPFIDPSDCDGHDNGWKSVFVQLDTLVGD